MRALLIDPFLQQIIEIEISEVKEGLHDLHKFIGCTTIDAVRLGRLSVLYVDDEGLHQPNQRYFSFKGYPQPLAGRGVITGVDGAGGNVSTTMSVGFIEDMVSWPDIEFSHETSTSGIINVFGQDMTHLTVTPHFKPRQSDD